MANIYRYPCVACGLPALKGKACCSKKCRDSVPTCAVPYCGNAVELGSICQGMNMPPDKNCYKHGGRVRFDGDPSGIRRSRRKCIIVQNKVVWG